MSYTGYLLARAIRYTDTEGGRIMALKCATCGREWNVRNRGRETGFIVAAADSHTMKCKRESMEKRNA
jgi:hypothetical protein